MSARWGHSRRGFLKPLALPALTLTLFAAAALPSHADEAPIGEQPLAKAIESGGAQPARFVLADGKTVIGRIVRINDEEVIIRRPSAGLLSLALADIVGVNIKTADGELLRGRVMKMADGGIGWVADGAPAPDTRLADVDPDTDVNQETGGPLIRFDDGTLDQVETPTETIAVKPADPVTPQSVNPAMSEPIRLSVTTEATRESDKLIYFRLTLSKPAEQSILIIYTMVNGTAVAPGDYTHRQGTVVFKPGQTQAVVATSIINDEVIEGAESFAFFITADPSAVIIDERKIAATIEDDDG